MTMRLPTSSVLANTLKTPPKDSLPPILPPRLLEGRIVRLPPSLPSLPYRPAPHLSQLFLDLPWHDACLSLRTFEPWAPTDAVSTPPPMMTPPPPFPISPLPLVISSSFQEYHFLVFLPKWGDPLFFVTPPPPFFSLALTPPFNSIPSRYQLSGPGVEL